MLNLLANAGTPLLWFGCLYPFVGSFGVAAIENVLLRKFGFVKSLPVRWNPVLIGNLLTTAIGIAFISNASRFGDFLLKPKPLEAANAYVAAVWVVAFVLTVLVEAPFFAKAVDGKLREAKTWKAALFTNSVTYAVLFLLALLMGQGRAGINVPVVPVRAISSQLQGWVYYVPPDSLDVRRIRLDGTGDEPTRYVLSDTSEDISIDTSDGLSADLVAFSGNKEGNVLAKLGKAGQCALVPYQKIGEGFIGPPLARRSIGYLPGRTFQAPGQSRSDTLDFDTFNMVWPDLGMTFISRNPKSRFTIALGSPFLSWNWKYATALPDGRVVVAFGPQIVVVDIPSRRIAWLANGRSPAVLLEQPFR